MAPRCHNVNHPWVLLLLVVVFLLVTQGAHSWKIGGGGGGKKPQADTALDQEMAELEELIRLQSKKLRLLEMYRKQAGGGSRGVSSGASTTNECAAPSSFFSHATAAGGSTGAPQAEDYLVRLGVVSATKGLDKGNEERKGVLTAVKMLTFQRVRDKTAPRGSPLQSSKAMNVLAVAREGVRGTDRLPWLSFYDLEGQLLTTYTPGHHTAITILAFEAGGASDDALLVTGARDGSLRLHTLTLWKDGKMVAGRRTSSSTSNSASPYLLLPNVTTEAGYGLQLQLETPLSSTSNDDLATTNRPTSEPPILSALMFQHRSFGWTVVSGDGEGNLKCHLRNGTLVKALYTGGHPIHALERNGKAILFTSNTDVHFLSATSFEPMVAHFCRGRHGPFRSLALDPLAPHLLHASTVHGDLLTFDVTPTHNNPRSSGRQLQEQKPFARGGAEEGHCALVNKVASRTGGTAPLILATLPGGYVLATSTRGDLFAYNTTDLRESGAPLSLVFHLMFSPPPSPSVELGPAANSNAPIFFSASLARTMAGPSMGTLTRLPSNFVLHVINNRQQQRSSSGGVEELLMFEALLPYRRPRPVNFAWVRLPLMLMAIALVFAWHFMKDKKPPRGGRMGMERNPMPAPAQLRNIGLRPQGRRMYDNAVEHDEDGIGFPGLAGINEEDDDDEDAEELNQRLRGLLRARQQGGGRDYAF